MLLMELSNNKGYGKKRYFAPFFAQFPGPSNLGGTGRDVHPNDISNLRFLIMLTFQAQFLAVEYSANVSRLDSKNGIVRINRR